MRKIIKKKYAAPPSFLKYKKAKNAAFEEMDKEVKQDLKASLIKEQHGICAYCQNLLKDKIKIEHHCEQTICDGKNGTIDRRLDYTNLFAVCIGETTTQEKDKNGLPKKVLHCDTLKSQFNSKNGLPIEVNPRIQIHIDKINYSSNGRILSKEERHDKEINSILGLNAVHLKDMRKRMWRSIFKNSRLTNGPINKEKMHKIIASLLTQKDGYFQHPFPAVAEYMLKRFD